VETARNKEIALAYETFGPPGGEPLLLISGTGAQMLIWPDDFCLALADRGFRVARFDNRDAGLSTHLTSAPAPGWLTVMLRPSAAPYRLADMADDALAVMDALGWPDAHVVGASLGGMIAQALAIGHPGRVRTLTSIMSTPSARIATMPTLAAIRALARAGGTPVTGPEQAADQAVALKKVIGSPGYPLDEGLVRDIAARSFQRHPGAGKAEQDDERQRAAVIVSGDRRRALAGLRIPALVIHGEQDPVIRPKGGRATARAIPGARLVTYPGMGHDLPAPLWPAIVDEITRAATGRTSPSRTGQRGLARGERHDQAVRGGDLQQDAEVRLSRRDLAIDIGEERGGAAPGRHRDHLAAAWAEPEPVRRSAREVRKGAGCDISTKHCGHLANGWASQAANGSGVPSRSPSAPMPSSR
jgi:pimeloyl-ACP methyl ester carboxylesterase